MRHRIAPKNRTKLSNMPSNETLICTPRTNSSSCVGLVKSCRLLQRRGGACIIASPPPLNLPSSVFLLACCPPPTSFPSFQPLPPPLSLWSPSRPLFLLSSYVWHSECLTERPPTPRWREYRDIMYYSWRGFLPTECECEPRPSDWKSFTQNLITKMFIYFFCVTMEVRSKSPDYMVEGQRQSESDRRTDRRTDGDGSTLHILSPK